MPEIIRSIDKLASGVFSTGGMAVTHMFRLDVTNYTWVKDYVRDQKTREEISRLQEEISKTRALLIDKNELRQMFLSRVEQINTFRIGQLKEHLARVQSRQGPLFSELIIGSQKVNGAHLLPFFMDVSEADLEAIFSGLPGGTTQKDIDTNVLALQDKIGKLQGVLSSDELSPQSRWFFRDTGDPESYPQGCRWSLFVGLWRKVVSRFEGKVNVEGYALSTPEEHMAFGLLELDRVQKITPLTKAR